MILTIKNKFIDRICEIYDGTDEELTVSGFRDSHCHLMWLGMKIKGLDLEGSKSPMEVINLCLEYQKKNNSNWIVGRGWNNEDWDISDLPTAELLDVYFPDNPVCLKRIDGHAVWLNSKALEIADINSESKDPDGGKIIKYDDGKPNGILVDNAIDLVEVKISDASDDELINYILSAQDECLNYGLLEVHDMDVHLDWLPIFDFLAKENKLKLNIKSYIRGFDSEFIKLGIKPYRINNLEIVGLKFFADGAIGSRGAKLLEDYSDEPENDGIYLIDKNDFIRLSLEGAKLGFEIATHAIGDAANRFVLDVYEELRTQNVDVPLRIEHCQMVHPDDLLRFKKLKIHAAIQPIHCISDRFMAFKRLGARVSYSYPWSSLFELGIKVSGGSDFPIESPDPILGINAFVKNDIIWQQREILSVKNAFDIYGVFK